jgi:HEAT repeat protein
MTTLEPVPSPPPSWEECMELLEQLPSLPLDERAAAIERLTRNSSPGIRERALRAGAAVFSDEQLTIYLRNDSDAVLRNLGLEVFKLRGGRSFGVALRLLKDDDPDVVLQAVLILDHLRDPRALEPLRGALTHPDPNVVQAAILAIGRLGNARSIPDLLPFLAGDPWLQMASVQALGDLRSPVAIKPLTELLTDLLAGSMAAEAIARIGGASAFRVLAAHWMLYGEQLEAEEVLGLLAHVLEGLSGLPAPFPGLAEALATRLADPALEVRTSAARCLLTVGPGPWDDAAIAVLAGAGLGTTLPPALARRRDLIARLLDNPGDPRAWGFHLAARYPRSAPAEAVYPALAGSDAAELLPAAVPALTRLRHPEIGRELLALHLRLSPEGRTALEPALSHHRSDVQAALAAMSTGVDPIERLVLGARLGASEGEVADGILALAPDERRAAIAQLADVAAAMRLLPWETWLGEEPERYSDLAAEVANAAGLRELLPTLRARTAEHPTPALVRALGELRDRDSLPVLLNLLSARRELYPLVLESLGRIGGPEARSALADAARQAAAGEARLAYRALSLCATEDDSALFRDAATHPDWYVRLACADVLTRFARPENMAPLALLAGDPVPAVAHRALSSLSG